MKKFEVLEAHQGDKFYKPGDPETGTRIAEANEVQHLVDLGVLKEIGDADPADSKPILEDGLSYATLANPEDAKTIADLRTQVADLTTARDTAVGEVSSLTTERDNARDEVVTLTKANDDVRTENAELTKKLEAATAARGRGPK